jgi:hypothetical protein
LLLRCTYIARQIIKQPEGHLDKSQKELSSLHLHTLIFPRVEAKPLNNRWYNLFGRYSLHPLAGDELGNVPVLHRLSIPTHRRLKSVKINAGRVKLCSSFRPRSTRKFVSWEAMICTGWNVCLFGSNMNKSGVDRFSSLLPRLPSSKPTFRKHDCHLTNWIPLRKVSLF